MDGIEFSWSFGPPKGQNTAKFWLSAPFLSCRSSLGRIDFWLGKWPPNPKILVGLESRLREISNELCCTSFWHLEGLQTGLQSARPVEEDVRDPLRESCQIWPVQPRNCRFDPSRLFEVNDDLYGCNCDTFWILLLLFNISRRFMHVKGKNWMYELVSKFIEASCFDCLFCSA